MAAGGICRGADGRATDGKMASIAGAASPPTQAPVKDRLTTHHRLPIEEGNRGRQGEGKEMGRRWWLFGVDLQGVKRTLSEKRI